MPFGYISDTVLLSFSCRYSFHTVTFIMISPLFSNYSLTEPLVSPDTILLWKIRTRITIGIVTMTVAAEISPHGLENSLVYIDIPTGTVRQLSLLLIVNANRYSFQAAIKTSIPVVNTPGPANGKIIFRKV